MTSTPTVVAHTPNGREIRLLATGRYEVQPHNDNYWMDCASVEEAMVRYYDPHGYSTGYSTVSAAAQAIIDSWESRWSIEETARVGLADEDQDAATKIAERMQVDARAVIAEVLRRCRELAAS